MSMEEITIHCNDGIELTGRRYYYKKSSSSSSTSSTSSTTTSNKQHQQRSKKILCWHGWLDNCHSFYKLGPALVDAFANETEHETELESMVVDVELIALNFPGHGTSSHKSLDGPSMVLMDYCYYVHEVLCQLKWNSTVTSTSTTSTDIEITLIGHSMGGAVSLMYAAAFPIHNLILLDSLGPHPKPSSDVTKSLKQHIKARLRGKPPSSIYSTMDEAIEMRCLTPKMFPGNQYISKQAATELVQGASIMINDDNGNDNDNGKQQQQQQKLKFLHDQRLKWTSILFLTNDHLKQIYQDVATSSAWQQQQPQNSTSNTIIKTKTCVLIAKDGMPFDATSLATMQGILKPTVFQTLPGSHHFHMDPDTSDGVLQAIIQFLQ